MTFDMTEYQGLSRLVSEMSQLRTAEGADPNVYYYGLFDNCGECIGGGAGSNPVAPSASPPTSPGPTSPTLRAGPPRVS
ncbi:hypothetical protein [Nannocystis pusilla]|uniref:hypothetical protein n=1 Tax=Nannocystis pusilla TaxID=889268 RepID=UPI003B8294B4